LGQAMFAHEKTEHVDSTARLGQKSIF
jgi:hypothetical protein